MDYVSTALINLLKLATSMRGAAVQMITFTPVEDIAADLFAGIAAEQEVELFAATVRAVAAGEQALGTGYEQINAVIRRVEDQPRNRSQFRARLEPLNAALDQVLTIAMLFASPSITGATVHLDDLQVFRLLRKLHIPHDVKRPEVIVIGALASGATTISFRKHRLLDKITIAYDRTSPYPRLNLETASISEDQVSYPYAPARKNWLQRDTLEHSLSLQNAHFKDVGTVRTRKEQRSYDVVGGAFAFNLSAPPGVELLSTTICDTANTVLAQCIRVIY